MNEKLHADILKRIEEFEFTRADGWFRKGKCPSCGKKELFTHAERPWLLKCGRLSKCRYEETVKERYDDLFQDWSKRTEEESKTNPNAAAYAYMAQSRGFDLERVRGWYTQESYYDKKADHGHGAATATVRFQLDGTWWERFIDRPSRFEKKANFLYKHTYRGTWWKPPTLNLAEVDELWLTEGIFNAIALDHHGVPAVSLMSSNNYPELALQELRKLRGDRATACVLVWALDADGAGQSYTKKWVERARLEGWECRAAQIPQRGKQAKVDWNDLHQLDRLKPADLDEYRYHGALLIARSAAEKGLLIYRHADGNKHEFSFDFERQLYWFKLDLDNFNREVQTLEKEDRLKGEELRDEALKRSHTIRQIANCLPQALYYQTRKVTDESWYYFRVSFPHDGAAVKNTFTAGQITAVAEFKKRLLSIAPGAWFSGTPMMLDRIMERQLYEIQRVETVDFIGYSKEHGCYVFPDLAVKDGRVVEINDEDFFDLGKLSIKSLSQSTPLAINRNLQEYSTEWVEMLWTCFGASGLAALTFWLGSLFAEQIRTSLKGFPFLEMTGEAGSGKSTMIEFLWKLVGRSEYEGFDPAKGSLSGRSRTFAQVSNLPVVLIESDRERTSVEKVPHVRSFDWDELKPLFNGRGIRTTGVKNEGNDTHEPPFRGSIVISQNAEVKGSEAILSRIVHMTFDRSRHTAETRKVATALETMPMERVSGWLLKALQLEAPILAKVREMAPIYEQDLRETSEVRLMGRVALCHGQMLALADALRLVVRISDEQHSALHWRIRQMAVERQRAIDDDHPLVAEFWELFDYLNEGNAPLNHHRDPDNFIAVNLNHFVKEARDRNQQVPDIAALKKVLPNSKRHRFTAARVVNSLLKAQNGTNASTSSFCWVFERSDALAKQKR